MAKVSSYPEVTQPHPQGFLFIAELQPDGSYETKKVSPDNIGLQGPVGPQGAAGTAGTNGLNGTNGVPGADGAAGTPGTNGAPGANGTNGAPGANGTNGTNGTDGVGFFENDGVAFDTFESYSAGAITVMDQGIGWKDDGICTGATIVSRTNAGNGTTPTENRLSLTSGEYIRKLPWGDAWNRIQLIIGFRVADVAAAFTGLGYFGLCSGQVNTAGTVNTDNFVGLVFNKGVNGWTLTAGTNVSYTGYASGQTIITRRVNTDTTLGGGTSGSDGRKYSVTEGFKSVLLLEISRPVFANDAASVTYNASVRSTDLTQVEFNHSKTQLWALLHETPTAGLAGIGGVNIGTGVEAAPGAAFDQSTGKLDTLNFVWPVATGQDFEIAAIGVRKLY